MRRWMRQRGSMERIAAASGGRLRWYFSAVAAIAVLGAAGSVFGVLPPSNESASTGEPSSEEEPSLDAAVVAQARRERADRQQARPPTTPALEAVERRVAARKAAPEREEVLPARVREENGRLRRQLDHLKAIEKEQKRVERALRLASAGYDGPLRLGRSGLAWPVGGPLVSPFGQRWGRLHAGVDIASPAGTVIRAAGNGGVAIAAPYGGYGNYVCLQHTASFTTCYAHLSRFLTRQGEVVRQGDPIGLVGCTGHCFGDHLHFETRVNGSPVDPMNYF
ncbi:MAG: M23 family metallopeptidase [Thermoleophilaceae bacterium]